jgi:hypothetical protein
MTRLKKIVRREPERFKALCRSDLAYEALHLVRCYCDHDWETLPALRWDRMRRQCRICLREIEHSRPASDFWIELECDGCGKLLADWFFRSDSQDDLPELLCSECLEKETDAV